MGSPIDKFYTIWDSAFTTSNLKDDFDGQIAWYNYWDESDPVGYGLKTVSPKLKDGREDRSKVVTDAHKMFDIKFDAGFSRYFIPGLAHVQYWKDSAIYKDIIHTMMGLGDPLAKSGVTNKWWGVIHVSIDKVAYYILRIVTVFTLVFFVRKILGQGHQILKLAQEHISFASHLSPFSKLGYFAVLMLTLLYMMKSQCPSVSK